MASGGAGAAASNDGAKEYVVRVPRTSNKKFSIMKFNPANKVDFTKCDGLKLERENNIKQHKVANDLEMMPQFGAGSEFGREQKQEARRKKYGISKKGYSPEDQPWLLKLGSGKTARKFKGVKEGGVTENASYFVFKQSADGAFEAFPLHEWYNFKPVVKYKSLNAEEAEEAFTQRDKTLNFFSIMVNKRLNKEEDKVGDDGEEGKAKAPKGKKSKKDFYLTELDEWDLLDSDGEGSDDEGSGSEKKKKPKKPTKKKTRKLAKRKGSDGEAEEESDDVDEGREVDYMTDTDSEDDDMYTDQGKTDKYEAKGVEDAVKSDEEEEEEEEKKEEEEEEEEQEDKEKQKKDSDSNDSSSGSDSDLDKDENIMSALFMQKKEKKKKGGSKENSRSNTPTVDDNKAQKRKTADTDSPAAKKSRSASPAPGASGSSPTQSTSPIVSSAACEGISEEAVRRYLMRKPMTAKDLLQKFKSKNPNIQKDKLVTGIAAMLKKINPEKSRVKDKLFLHIRKT